MKYRRAATTDLTGDIDVELPLAFKIMLQYGHDTELSPKTYCEIAGENTQCQNQPSQPSTPPPPLLTSPPPPPLPPSLS